MLFHRKKKEKIEKKKKTTLCVSSVTVLLHGTTLDLGASFNGGGQRLVSVLPWDRDCLGPRGFSATSDPMESELGEVWGK